MNIEQANNVPISYLLDKQNVKPVRKSGHNLYYISPLREEKTASFHVDTKKNQWYDHGLSVGGDCVKFCEMYLESKGQGHSVSHALQWIANECGNVIFIAQAKEKASIDEKALIIKNVQSIQHLALVQYLDARCIPLEVGRKYFKELKIFNQKSKKYFYTLGFKNDEDGYELRNEYFKGNVGGKAITFVRGTEPESKCIHIFEGSFDFTSIVAGEKARALRDDAIILNSVSMLEQAKPYIQNYGYKVAYSWLDNDKAGMTAKTNLDGFLKAEIGLRHMPLNYLFKPHKDVNDWRIATLSPKTAG